MSDDRPSLLLNHNRFQRSPSYQEAKLRQMLGTPGFQLLVLHDPRRQCCRTQSWTATRRYILSRLRIARTETQIPLSESTGKNPK
jgi:hypothetical protein